MNSIRLYFAPFTGAQKVVLNETWRIRKEQQVERISK